MADISFAKIVYAKEPTKAYNVPVADIKAEAHDRQPIHPRSDTDFDPQHFYWVKRWCDKGCAEQHRHINIIRHGSLFSHAQQKNSKKRPQKQEFGLRRCILRIVSCPSDLRHPPMMSAAMINSQTAVWMNLTMATARMKRQLKESRLIRHKGNEQKKMAQKLQDRRILDKHLANGPRFTPPGTIIIPVVSAVPSTCRDKSQASSIAFSVSPACRPSTVASMVNQKPKRKRTEEQVQDRRMGPVKKLRFDSSPTSSSSTPQKLSPLSAPSTAIGRRSFVRQPSFRQSYSTSGTPLRSLAPSATITSPDLTGTLHQSPVRVLEQSSLRLQPSYSPNLSSSSMARSGSLPALQAQHLNVTDFLEVEYGERADQALNHIADEDVDAVPGIGVNNGRDEAHENLGYEQGFVYDAEDHAPATAQQLREQPLFVPTSPSPTFEEFNNEELNQQALHDEVVELEERVIVGEHREEPRAHVRRRPLFRARFREEDENEDLAPEAHLDEQPPRREDADHEDENLPILRENARIRGPTFNIREDKVIDADVWDIVRMSARQSMFIRNVIPFFWTIQELALRYLDAARLRYVEGRVPATPRKINRIVELLNDWLEKDREVEMTNLQRRKNLLKVREITKYAIRDAREKVKKRRANAGA